MVEKIKGANGEKEQKIRGLYLYMTICTHISIYTLCHCIVVFEWHEYSVWVKFGGWGVGGGVMVE